MSFLRAGLLSERSIALAGSLPAAICERLSALGARTAVCDGFEEERLDEERLLEWAAAEAPLDALVCAGASLESLDRTWAQIRCLATGALIPASRGAIVLIAPAPSEVTHGEALRAALENLARTLSVEWSRFGLTVTAVAPADTTSADELSTLVAFLCSPAGAYFSGCRLDLDSLKR